MSREHGGATGEPRAEHIHIEAEPDVAAPIRHPHRKVRTKYALVSRMRGCSTEISILEDHFASVVRTRPGAETKKYTLDLRFANPKPVLVRHIAWMWLGISIVLLLAASTSLWRTWSTSDSFFTSTGFFAAAAVLLGGVATGFVFLRQTSESLSFTSVHGQAVLIEVTAGIGGARAGKVFFVELIKNIGAAKVKRPQSPQQFLRDEMREHHRLHELDVLSDADYEASKARILASHQ